MPDSQLPRFQVFLQPNPGAPHSDAGSVHAPDLDMALMNARDVFARRPDCHNLWVAPVEAIFSTTSAELAHVAQLPENNCEAAEMYHIFAKLKPAGPLTHVSSLVAGNPHAALLSASENLDPRPQASVWWVIPARMVLASQPDEVASLFDPANDKPFRLATDFHVLTALRSIRADRQPPEPPALGER
jgi:ring-1,2-phenylacetyl-CoA epoxidase subunit PaaB